jgi:hypothetical protein
VSDDLVLTLRTLLAELEALGAPYMLVGSVAALAYGRSRATQDFDLVVALDEPTARKLVRALPSERFYASEEDAVDAVRHATLFNVIDLATGWKVDIVPLKRRAFSQREFQRRRLVEVLGLSVFVASVEDVIVAKLEWSMLAGGSARQTEDVVALIELTGPRLDVGYIEETAAELNVTEGWRAARAAVR